VGLPSFLLREGRLAKARRDKLPLVYSECVIPVNNKVLLKCLI
jgi:hypothetical protein